MMQIVQTLVPSHVYLCLFIRFKWNTWDETLRPNYSSSFPVYLSKLLVSEWFFQVSIQRKYLSTLEELYQIFT